MDRLCARVLLGQTWFWMEMLLVMAEGMVTWVRVMRRGYAVAVGEGHWVVLVFGRWLLRGLARWLEQAVLESPPFPYYFLMSELFWTDRMWTSLLVVVDGWGLG
ncbi:hypothetical protein AGABI1DRAFT_88292 [Agaricus bisporus var. burnettii JB137-S8]|uniref:Uncharacterized protein n=1 Tax=Agaricus bisporus var. burnettii (strain JB137-S8 / ATCC MYA-4627 / FGSC 10392) TaxID=597362 RepID=K5VJV1_AGABU|nr:uncharacterized protein AGABI1DRAFT_88292 [Agaricus bisporus var. burnettii JB137-S8]EKM74594.1 hypothetical protein AGABI1DRAFT_88292 [Agaricus bisporus var. burnettii JB137-S8]